MKTETNVIIAALRILAEDLPNRIQDKNISVARPLTDAADRLEELQRKVRNQRRELEYLKGMRR